MSATNWLRFWKLIEDARMQTWQLNPAARWRRGMHGGAAFFPSTATTIELDEEAFAAAQLLTQPHTARSLRPQLIAQFQRNFTLAEIDIFLRDLAVQELLRAAPQPTAPAIHFPTSPAPESVHLQLNNVCNLRCPSCYVGLHAADVGSLPLERIYTLIEELVTMGVFQLALGGGEALLSPKFVLVTRYARQHGLVPNVTTNGWLIKETLLDEVSDHLGEWRLSLNDAVTVHLPLLAAKAALLRERKMRFGFNVIVTANNLPRLRDLLSWACDQGAATLNLIRPKPAPGNERWYAANPPPPSHTLAALLHELEPMFTHTALTVDCAFSFLFYGQPAHALQARGVAGCAMGDRFATIKWNGDVTPCSHLHSAEFNAGNVRNESFQIIWERSTVFAEVRRTLPQVEGTCGSCQHNAFCKGCRAVMQLQTGNWLAEDQDCGMGVS
jgi:radical SAM protein with 4Fe4S-binding SPASM domain